jgi:hypothetical protein
MRRFYSKYERDYSLNKFQYPHDPSKLHVKQGYCDEPQFGKPSWTVEVLDAESKWGNLPSCCRRLGSRIDIKVSKLCEEYMRIYNFCNQWYGRHVSRAVPLHPSKAFYYLTPFGEKENSIGNIWTNETLHEDQWCFLLSKGFSPSQPHRYQLGRKFGRHHCPASASKTTHLFNIFITFPRRS